MSHPPRILLADCDQMFVAVARQADPERAGRARFLVVGGKANSRGVVCSASYEARAFGIRAGMPIAQAARLCPQAMFVPVPGRACREAHQAIRAELERWAPVVVPASIDEFYLDLTGTERLYRGEPLEVTAARVRAAVLAATGFTLSVGGATNRLVAKMAAERAKPRPGSGGTGILVIAPGQEAAFLARCALAEIPGVGPRLQEQFRRLGLTMVREALALDQRTLVARHGTATGRWLYRALRGDGSADLRPIPESKSISRETTFARDLGSDEAIEARLLRLLTELAAELRRDGLATRCITVKLRDRDFRTRQASRTVADPLSTDRALFQVARGLLAGLRQRRRIAARLVGVGFSRLQPRQGPDQLDLLREAKSVETDRDFRLAAAVDRIAAKLGRSAIGPARLAGRSPRQPPRAGFRGFSPLRVTRP
jgi:DNA polymerase-4